MGYRRGMGARLGAWKRTNTYPPVFTVAPTTAVVTALETIQFTAEDPEGAAVIYSLVDSHYSASIHSSTGLVSHTLDAETPNWFDDEDWAAYYIGTGPLNVRASDGELYTDHTCQVTIGTNHAPVWSLGSTIQVHGWSLL